VLGKRRTVLLGAITMAVGHFLMAFELTFLFALLCLILGSGMLKGNIASQVGALYKPEDFAPRRRLPDLLSRHQCRRDRRAAGRRHPRARSSAGTGASARAGVAC
jgi:hypothetical protein